MLGQEGSTGLVPRQKPFRFGVGPGGVRFEGPQQWADFARRVEDLGFSTLSVGDHLTGSYGPLVAMTALACSTTSLRIGALTFCNDYRHPVVLAQEISTLDVVSGGRVELGLGAGWMTADYERSGMTMDTPARRIARLAEAVAVLKGTFASGPVSYSGDDYRIAGHEGLPKPVQHPWPPILIGGSGPKVLRLAAREADIVGLNVSLRAGTLTAVGGESASLDATVKKLATVRDAAGPRWEHLELEICIHVADVRRRPSSAVDRTGQLLGLSPAEAARSPHVLVGSVGEVADVLLARRDELGISYISVGADAVEQMAPVVARLAGS